MRVLAVALAVIVGAHSVAADFDAPLYTVDLDLAPRQVRAVCLRQGRGRGQTFLSCVRVFGREMLVVTRACLVLFAQRWQAAVREILDTHVRVT